MDLKDWFASRQKRRENLQVKQPLTTEEYCALWTQCFQCRELLYTRDLRNNLQVCPKCQYHFRIGAEQRIEQLCDADSFQELDAEMISSDPLGFVDTDSYPNRQLEASQKSGLKEAVVTGVCRMNDQPVAVGIMDFGHFGGSMGSVVGEKITRLIEHAQKQSLPLIVIASSGGARMQEGLLSLMQMAKTSSALKSYSDAGLLYISILTEPTFGGVTASFAMLGDIIIAEPGARIGFAGRRVIEQTIRQKLPADFQTAEYLLKNGQVDMVIERATLKEVLCRLITFHARKTAAAAPDKDPQSRCRLAILIKAVGSKLMATTEKKTAPLEFEQPLALLAQQIEALEKQLAENPNTDLDADISHLRDQYTHLKRSLYSNLRPIDHLALARHPQRPYSRDYFERWDPSWVELHGDRQGMDDPAMVVGLLQLDEFSVVAVGTQKGRTLRDKQLCNFGMPQPEGYRKALRAFLHAQKFALPIVTLIDTPGAYPGLTAEEHNQSQAIAVNLRELAGLDVPVVALVTGEGGSGGALAVGVANRILMLEHSVYSVISPEGCASILWRSSDRVSDACQAMKMTAREIQSMGIVDEVIDEPLGGAHHDYDFAASNAKNSIVRHLRQLGSLKADMVRGDRQRKFRQIGSFVEAS